MLMFGRELFRCIEAGRDIYERGSGSALEVYRALRLPPASRRRAQAVHCALNEVTGEVLCLLASPNDLTSKALHYCYYSWMNDAYATTSPLRHTLSEQRVIEAFHTLATTALEQAQTEGLLDPAQLQDPDFDQLQLLGPSLILFFAALASRPDEPSVKIPTNPPSTLNSEVRSLLTLLREWC